jgi:hypothetical protein
MSSSPLGSSPAAQESPIVIGSREQLFHLLAEAAEIEHTLMCCYLYAAFSLKTDPDSGLSRDELDAVTRWRKAIMGVAVEEMCHLLLVANLSIAIGGRPHFGRPNFPVSPGYFPSGVVVKLMPFSAATLQHLIFLERPQGIDHADGQGFAPQEDYRREEAYHGLMPSAQDYSTVGHLYEALRANLKASARHLGEAALFIGPVSTQVGPDVVQLEGVTSISDLRSALKAIDTIVEQGEGAASDRANSHYQRFLTIEAEYRELLKANPEFMPAWPAAESPVMRRPPEADGKTFIDDLTSARVLDFGNAVYGVLLRCLVQGFGREGAAAAVIQRRYIDAAIGLMPVLSRVGSALVSMPASADRPEVHAGMTFTMLRSVEPFFFGGIERALMQERLGELQAGARGIASISPLLNNLPGAIAEIVQRWNS